MTSKVNRVRIWLGLLIMLGLLLAACGDSSTVSVGTSTTASTTFAPATTAPVTTTAGTTAPTSTIVTSSPIATAAPITAKPTTNAPATTAASTTAPATTGVANPGANAGGNIIYQNDKKLWAYNVATGLKFSLSKNVEVAKYSLSPDSTKVAFLFTENITLKLALVKVQSTQVDEPVILDDKIADLSLQPPNKDFGPDLRPFSVAFSPDGSQLAYTKENTAAGTLEKVGGYGKPTELWVNGLAPNSNRQLVPNDKDYIFRPIFSTDGNRISFVHTGNFGTGAGYSTVLWSVYKDGSRLSYLAGPELPAKNQSMSPAFDFIWIAPKLLTFKVFGGASGLWLHDLDTGNPRPLAFNIDPAKTFYDDAAQRYLYFDGKNSQTTGVATANDKPVLLAEGATPLDFTNSVALYFDQQKKVTLVSVNTNGTVTTKSVSFQGDYSSTKYPDNIQAKFGRESGQFVAISWSDSTNTNKGYLQVYQTNGQPLAATPLAIESGRMKWLDANHVVILGYTGTLQVVDLTSGQPVLKTVDSGKNIHYQPILDF